MKKHGAKERGKRIRWGRIGLLIILIYIGALTIPYIQHKKVSDSYKKQFDPKDCYAQEPGSERALQIIQKL